MSLTTMECKNIDDKLLDFLYEELEQKEQEAFRAHLDGCARCQAEVNALGRVRQAAKQLTLVDPPASVSAKVLFQAAQRKPRGKVIPLFRRMVSHPAYAMAAAFLIVGGVAGWQLMVHGELKGAPPATETAPATPTPTAALKQEPKAPELPDPTATVVAPPTTITPVVEAPAGDGKLAKTPAATTATTAPERKADYASDDSKEPPRKEMARAKGAEESRSGNAVYGSDSGGGGYKAKDKVAPPPNQSQYVSKPRGVVVNDLDGVSEGEAPAEWSAKKSAKQVQVRLDANQNSEMAKSTLPPPPKPAARPADNRDRNINNPAPSSADPSPPAPAAPPVIAQTGSANRQSNVLAPVTRSTSSGNVQQQTNNYSSGRGVVGNSNLAGNTANNDAARKDLEAMRRQASSLAAADKCTEAVAKYQQMQEAFGESSAEDRLSLAHCQTVRGNYKLAQEMLDRLRAEGAPNLKPRIDYERTLLSNRQNDQQAQRSNDNNANSRSAPRSQKRAAPAPKATDEALSPANFAP